MHTYVNLKFGVQTERNPNSVLQPEKTEMVQLPGGPRSETVEQNSLFCGKTEIFSVLKRKLLCIETVKFLFPNRNIFRSETEIRRPARRQIPQTDPS